MDNMNNKNKKILLLNPCGWQKESINLGLSYLATPLIKEGFEVLIFDLNRYELEDAVMLKRVCAFAPFMIGISLKTATATEGGRLARLLAETLLDVPIVGGGPHMTLCADDYMTDNPAFSYGVMGEGEESHTALAIAVYEGRSVYDMPGVIWRNGKNVVINEWAPPQNLDALPFPNLDIIEGFSWQNFRYPILTSRGCPFSCIYCCVNKLTGSKKWRSRTPQSVVEEIEFLVRTKGIYSFEIWDDNFTLDIKRAKEICRELIARRLSLSWWCHNGIRADRIDLELAELMKKAGCTSIAFGMETGDPETFASIKKGEPLSAVVNAVKTIKKAGIQAVGYFIIGLPGDNLETFIETVHFQRKLKLDHYTYGMLIPYPKTELWDIVHEQGELLCKITETQHFSDDIVPVSFELPSFPKADMVRAFYIAKYFDLFDVTTKVAGRSGLTVVYLITPEIISHLPGMFVACDPQVRHVVVGADEAAIRALPSFTQVPKTLTISFAESIPTEIPSGSQITVCRNHPIPMEQIFLNSGLVLFNPQRPLYQVILVRLPVAGFFGIPKIVLSGVGICRALPRILAAFGADKLREVFAIQVVRPIRAKQVQRVRQAHDKLQGIRTSLGGMAIKPLHAFRSITESARLFSANSLVTTMLQRLRKSTGRTKSFLIYVSNGAQVFQHSMSFLRVKKNLLMKRKSKKDFPYDENSSYL